MTGRFDRPGLLATVTRAAVLDGTPLVIRNAVTHSTARRRRTGPDDERPRRPAGPNRRPAGAQPRAD